LIIVDTTVLVYAVGAEHRLREPSRRVVAAITEGALEGTTIVGIIQEFAHVRARRYGRADATRRARQYVELLAPLLPVEREELKSGLRLFEQHSALSSFDAVLAAVALNRETEALVSSDQAFSAIRRLRHVDPATTEFDELLHA
jgi:hypothetical protein